MSAALTRAETLTALRARLGQTPLRTLERRSTGLGLLDTWLGGWPSQGLVELVGAPGTVRLGLVTPLLVELTAQGRPIAVVDPGGIFYPPGAGLCNNQVLLVRPPAGRAGWAAEQIVRSGALEAVLLLGLSRPGRAGAVRLVRAVEASRCLVFLVNESPDPDLSVALRLELRQDELWCTRSRSGHEGERRRILRGG